MGNLLIRAVIEGIEFFVAKGLAKIQLENDFLVLVNFYFWLSATVPGMLSCWSLGSKKPHWPLKYYKYLEGERGCWLPC